MSKKKILTLEDLYNYYSSTSKRSRHFSARDDDRNIAVQVSGNIVFSKEDDDPTEGLTKVVLQANHTEENINHTYISEDTVNNALASFINRPILAFVHLVDGQYEFYDHRRHKEDGEVVYDERPVGIVPESADPHLEYDEEKERTYVVVNGYIFDEYSKASEILEREGECACSIEIDIKELSYDAKKQLLIIEKYTYNGVTILGKDPEGNDINPGMQGANIKLADFTQNSMFSQTNMIAMLDKINSKLDQLSIQTFQRKEENGQMNKFEELLAKYSKSVEDITFEYEGLDDEALEAAFAEAFGDEGGNTPDNGNEPESQNANGGEGNPEQEETPVTNDVEFSVKINDAVKTFSVTLVEKYTALYNLVNETYGETDDEWYDIDADEDAKEVYMHGYFTGKHFKQKYSMKKDTFALQGDRVELFTKYLTADEVKKLESLQADYAEVSDKLVKYEEEPKKIEILNDKMYASVAESEDFVALKEEVGHFDLSIEDVRSKANEILLEAISAGKFSFANPDNSKPEVTVKPIMGNTPTKRSRYGGLGKKEN